MKAISFRLNREALELLHNAPEKIQFELNGSDSAMVIGGKSFSVNVMPDPTIAHELYMGTSGIDIEHVANVTHRATMKQVLSQEDKTRYRSRKEAAEREKNARRIELLDGPNVPSPRKAATPIRRVVSPSTHRSSPRPPTATTPNPIHTSTPAALTSNATVTTTAAVPNSSSTNSTMTTTSSTSTSSTLRERLIHLLAIQPLPLIHLTAPLRTRDEDLIPVLKKVASLSKGNWRLRHDVYPEIRIWDWRYDEKERNIVIKNAQEAYKALNLPRNAPERSNLQPKKSHHLFPPPSQQRPPTNTSVDAPSPPRKRPASTATPSATTDTNNATPAPPPPKKKKKQKTSKSKSSSSSTAAAVVPQPPPQNHHQPLTTAMVPDNTSSESDDEYNEPFIVNRITSQAEFFTACKRHDEAQAEYTHLKSKISKEHPRYIEALAHVDSEMSNMMEDGSEAKHSFYRKLRSFYLSHGGTQPQWRAVIQLCRQFNWTLAKVNTLWEEIERSYNDHHFSLPVNTKNNHD